MDTYTIKNNKGMSVVISDYGATILHIYVQDKDGNVRDVVYGYDTMEEYVKGDDYVGATVGRFANRIKGANFDLDGVHYELNKNNGENQCHGGLDTFDKRTWTLRDGSDECVVFTLRSPDGDENFPGNLDITVCFSLSDDGELKIRYVAGTDRATPANLTNHSYFNLGGRGSGDVFDTVLWIDAESYLRTDEELIPTGEIVPVEGTPFDFREPKTIGRGYDHCFNFTNWKDCKNGGEVKPRAMAANLKTGITLEMFTNLPCVQLYTANTLTDHPFEAFCLETQKMPDSMHHDNFTDCIMRPGVIYDYTTIYKFGIIK